MNDVKLTTSRVLIFCDADASGAHGSLYNRPRHFFRPLSPVSLFFLQLPASSARAVILNQSLCELQMQLGLRGHFMSLLL